MSATRTALEGILAPITTPFDGATGEVSQDALQRNVRAHLEAGVHGIVVAGSTGEAALLDESERGRLMEWTRELVPPERWLLAGVGAESTRATIRLARQAAERGADAVLVVAPHYYGSVAMTASVLGAHYLSVADASPVPVVLYNIPKFMHFSLGPAIVGELSAHPNIIGIKDSSGDEELLSAYLNTVPAQFVVFTGSAALLARALRMGARGGVLAAATFAPSLPLAIWEAARRGSWEPAEVLQERLRPLAMQIVGELGVPGVKAALDAVGLAGGSPRRPLQPLDGTGRTRIAALLQAAQSPPA